MNRGNETPNHLDGKQQLAALFTRRAFLILYEHCRSDVVGWRIPHGRLRTICGEHDRSARTLLPNVRRDFRNGCNAIVILAPNEALSAAFRRKLKRHFPRPVWTLVGIITYATCSALLAREATAPAAVVNPVLQEP